MGITQKTYEAIAIEALSLPGPDRRDLVGRLLRSLDDGPYPAEHLEITEKRLEAIRSGAMETKPAEEVMEQIRTKYGL